MKTITLILAFAAAAFAQTGSPVNQTAGPPPEAILQQFFYDASNNLEYVCYAPQRNASTTQKRSDSTLTNIVDAAAVSTITTAAAHGLYIGARVTISGATVDTDLNGVYTIVTVPSTTTYTIATANVTDATYTESTLVITTTNPLLTEARWSIKRLIYNGSNYLIGSIWANANVGYGTACSTRATY